MPPTPMTKDMVPDNKLIDFVENFPNYKRIDEDLQFAKK